jgi:hypothetical protein
MEPLMEQEFRATSMRASVLLQLPQWKKHRPQLDSKGLGPLNTHLRRYAGGGWGVLSDINFYYRWRE